jgi:hypothetical protein
VHRLDLARGVVERPLLEEQVSVRERIPAAPLVDVHQAVAVHRLHDERPGGPQHAPELGEGAAIPVLAAVPESGEEVQRRVEARVLERQLAVVCLNPLRPLAVACTFAGLFQQDRGAVDADDAVACAGENDRVSPVAARSVEHVRAGLHPG